MVKLLSQYWAATSPSKSCIFKLLHLIVEELDLKVLRLRDVIIEGERVDDIIVDMEVYLLRLYVCPILVLNLREKLPLNTGEIRNEEEVD